MQNPWSNSSALIVRKVVDCVSTAFRMFRRLGNAAKSHWVLTFIAAVVLIRIAVWMIPPSETELRLHAVGQASNGNSDAAFDVVFIHGLGGHWKETWSANKDEDSFWPIWVSNDFSQAKIWSMEYPACPTHARYAMPLQDRAKTIIEAMKNEGLGKRRTVFITHSLGGLVFKQVYRQLRDSRDPNDNEVARNIKGVVFLATPHTGSNAANLVEMVSQLSGNWATDSLVDLVKNDAALRDLNVWYREHDDDICLTSVYFETRALGPLGLVVDQSSADGGIASPIPVDADHFSICKPQSRDSVVYKSIQRFLRDFIDLCENTPRIGEEPSFASLVSPDRRVTDEEVAQGLAHKLVDFSVRFSNKSNRDATIWILSHEEANKFSARERGAGWCSINLAPGEVASVPSKPMLASRNGWFYLFVQFPPGKAVYMDKRCLGLHFAWEFVLRGVTIDEFELSEIP